MAKNEQPIFFAAPKEFRVWLRAHHKSAREQWVGLYRKAAGLTSITWPEIGRRSVLRRLESGRGRRIPGLTKLAGPLKLHFMKTFHKLVLAAVLAASAIVLAPNATAQRLTIEIGDRPYYTRGPSYWDGGFEYYWVRGHWNNRHRWVRGHYVRRETTLRKLRRGHIRLDRAFFR